MTQQICRWGILGTATIAQKNWRSIRNAENCTLSAVASRTADRARQFIDQCQGHVPFPAAPRACGSYEELLASDQVDAVYIPLPTALRKQWVIRAAEAGKHVLCEKPCGGSSADVAEMIDACQQNQVQFMDGVMFMHSQRLPRIRGVLDDGESVGTLKRICSQFSFFGPEEFVQGNIRTRSDLEPLGCLGDLGWYNLRFTLWVMDWQMPQRAAGRLLSSFQRGDSPHAVPTEFSGELFFADGVSASFYCSFLTEQQQWAHLSGSKGFIHIPDFVLPYYRSEVAFEVTNSVFSVNRCDFHMEEHTRRISIPEYSDSKPNAQEANLFRTFAALVLAGKVDPRWHRIALQTQQVLDACLASARAAGQLVDLREGSGE